MREISWNRTRRDAPDDVAGSRCGTQDATRVPSRWPDLKAVISLVNRRAARVPGGGARHAGRMHCGKFSTLGRGQRHGEPAARTWPEKCRDKSMSATRSRLSTRAAHGLPDVRHDPESPLVPAVSRALRVMGEKMPSPPATPPLPLPGGPRPVPTRPLPPTPEAPRGVPPPIDAEVPVARLRPLPAG